MLDINDTLTQHQLHTYTHRINDDDEHTKHHQLLFFPLSRHTDTIIGTTHARPHWGCEAISDMEN
jgi:hypothetical protein